MPFAGNTPANMNFPIPNQNDTEQTMPLIQAGRALRSASVSTATRLLEYNPTGGMWQATGAAIAHAPNLSDLRSPYEVGFDVHGHSVRRVSTTQGTVSRERSRRLTAPTIELKSEPDDKSPWGAQKQPSECQDADGQCFEREEEDSKLSWGNASKKGGMAVWAFLCTPTGLFITIYGLNVIAWGAMLFFLLLNVGSMSKERKEIWIEIDSQVLNGLFCLTSWGLAPWRIRDAYWLLVWRVGSGQRSRDSLKELAKRNKSWFRRRAADLEDGFEREVSRKTAIGRVAPATKTWKMDFVVVNLLLNSLFQIGMATFMWHYNRHNRPSFGVGLFIGLGCFSSLLAGVMSWWEGRKVKLIEGPTLEERQETIL